jgi:hypothetical protein
VEKFIVKQHWGSGNTQCMWVVCDSSGQVRGTFYDRLTANLCAACLNASNYPIKIQRDKQ